MPGDLAKLVRDSLLRELEELRDQVRALAQPLSEQQFWTKPIEPGNSFGHLVLHLTGNLSHFVGAQLGATGYVRDREREFTEPNLPPKDDALAALDGAVAVCRRVVASLSAEQLSAPHPTERLGTTMNALVHLVAHFALHRGQMSYICRLVEKTAPRA
jgi:uncharacterized damage-inducible protein DinB